MIPDRALALLSSARRAWLARGYTGPSVAVMGLAIGVTLCSVVVFETVVLRPFSYDDAGRLVALWAENPSRGWSQEYIAPANLLDWRDQVGAFQGLTAYREIGQKRTVSGDVDAEVVQAGLVDGGFFDVLGVPATLGRGFRPEETWDDAEPATVLSHDLWTRKFGADRTLVGRTLLLDGVSHRVVGVMPPSFRHPGASMDLWVTFQWSAADRSDPSFRRAHSVRVIGRLAAGTSREAARAELQAVAARLAEAYPETNDGLTADIGSLQDFVRRGRTGGVALLLSGALLLLAVTSATVANLAVLRWSARARALEVRRALGASPGQVLREMVRDAGWVVSAGVLLGLAVGVLALRALPSVAPPALLQGIEPAVGPAAITAVGVFATMFGAILVLAPLSVVRAHVFAIDRSELSGSSAPARGTLAGAPVFVVLQIAVSVVLLFSSSLLARDFLALANVPTGFDAEGVLSFALRFPGDGDSEPVRLGVAEAILAGVEQIPGVSSAGAVRVLPMTESGWTSPFTVEGRAESGATFDVVHRSATPGYFTALRVPLVRGRMFEPADRLGEGAVVINETMAAAAFPDSEPVGQRIAFTDEPSVTSTWWRIVGVVGDERQNGPAEQVLPEIFNDLDFDTPQTFRFVVRGSGRPESLVPPIRAVVASLRPDLAIDEIASMRSVSQAALTSERFLAAVAAAFAILATVLAAGGVYCVTAVVATERWTREMAIRLALGASPRSLFGRVVSRAAVVTGIGLALGLGGSIALAQIMQSVLVRATPGDPIAAGAAVGVVTVGSLLAALPAATRAMRSDPAAAMARRQR